MSLKSKAKDYPLLMNETSTLKGLNGIYEGEGNQTIKSKNNDKYLRTSIIHSRCSTVDNNDYPTSPSMK